MQKDLLIDAFLTCHTPSLLHEFLVDLLTKAEREEFTQRFLIARLLHQGESYKMIEEQTGASSTTIARVAKFLHRHNSGYKTILDNLKKK